MSCVKKENWTIQSVVILSWVLARKDFDKPNGVEVYNVNCYYTFVCSTEFERIPCAMRCRIFFFSYRLYRIVEIRTIYSSNLL